MADTEKWNELKSLIQKHKNRYKKDYERIMDTDLVSKAFLYGEIVSLDSVEMIMYLMEEYAKKQNRRTADD